MNVAQYTFQSPSTSAVQVGKLDLSSVKEEATKSSSQSEVESKNITDILTPDTSNAVQDIKPTVDGASLDIYV